MAPLWPACSASAPSEGPIPATFSGAPHHLCCLPTTYLQVKADALEREVQAVDNEFSGVLQVLDRRRASLRVFACCVCALCVACQRAQVSMLCLLASTLLSDAQTDNLVGSDSLPCPPFHALQSDACRGLQLRCHTAKEGHLFRKFGCGAAGLLAGVAGRLAGTAAALESAPALKGLQHALTMNNQSSRRTADSPNSKPFGCASQVGQP